MGKDVIIACDFSGRDEVLAFLDKFTGRKPFVKIGMELFYAAGPDIVREIKARGYVRLFSQNPLTFPPTRDIMMVGYTHLRTSAPKSVGVTVGHT